jgi:hypothetical protein
MRKLFDDLSLPVAQVADLRSFPGNVAQVINLRFFFENLAQVNNLRTEETERLLS